MHLLKCISRDYSFGKQKICSKFGKVENILIIHYNIDEQWYNKQGKLETSSTRT